MQELSDINFSIVSKLRKLYLTSSNYTVSFLNKVKMTEHLFMIIIAIIIGVLAGFGAIGIRALIKLISDISFTGDGSILQNIINAPWYIKILAPVIGGLIVGPIIYFFAPEAKGHGVPEVMQAILTKGGIIRPRVAVIKSIASAITIGTGGSVGREGPIIQIGSSLGSTIGQFFNVPSKRLKTLVGCGAGAGIAAAFNAPIAGALFAVEIVLMDFTVAQFSPIVISSVMATVISHHFEGDFAAFQVPAYHLQNSMEIFLYFGLGIVTGLVSYLFIKVLYFFEDIWDNKIKIPDYMKAGIGGLIVGATALLFPQIMGVGYDSINIALNGNTIWYLAIVLIFIKIFVTSVTLGSGGSGGIFAPSLFMGAMTGVAFGLLANYLFPGNTADPGAYALVAMGGLVAGTTRAPITAIIIVFELTMDYDIVLPLMVTCILSMIISTKLSKESIYTLKLLLRNINVRERPEMNILKSIYVKDIYQKEYASITENKKFNDIVEAVISQRVPYISVEDHEGNFKGMISIHNIKNFILDKDELKFVCIAGDICDNRISKANLDDDCKTILEKMDKIGYDGLPVVNSKNPTKQIGMIWRKDIDNSYRKEVEYQEMTSDLADKISSANIEKDVRFLDGYVITEMPVPKQFIGHSIKELNIRANYGVDIISIKSSNRYSRQLKALPQADYKFSEQEFLIIAGKVEEINKLKRMSEHNKINL